MDLRATTDQTYLVYDAETRLSPSHGPRSSLLALLFLSAVFVSASALAVPSPTPNLSLGSAPSAAAPSGPERSPTAVPPGRSPTPTVTKASVLERLRDLQARQNQVITNIDNMVRKKLGDSTAISLKGTEAKSAERKIELLAQSLDELDSRRREFSARRDFLDQLIFQVDSKWSTEPLPVFLEHALLNIALNDLTATSASEPASGTRLWKFATFLSVSMREAIEPREDAISFLEGYMNFASVTDPKPPSEFVASRAYSNGTLSSGARPVDRDRLGDDLEKRLKGLKDGSSSATTGKPANGKTTTSSDQEPLEIRVRAADLETRKSLTPPPPPTP